MKWVLVFTAFLSACQALNEGAGAAPPRIQVNLQFAFDELKAAVDGGEDEIARAILSRLRPRITDPVSASLADGYEALLVGREIRDSIKARVLVGETSEGFAVALELQQIDSSKRGGQKVLRFTPGHIKVEWTARCIDSSGRQSTQVGARVLPEGVGWSLPPGELVEVPLGVDSPTLGEGVFAVRCEWRVFLGAGSAQVGDAEEFPVMRLPVVDGKLVRLSKELPTAAVDPEELLRYALGKSVRREALLERAVRISPDRYADALDLLGANSDQLTPARFEELIPVLAWLTGSSGMNASGGEWREWLESRGKDKDRGGSLDLPDASIARGLELPAPEDS